MSEPKTRGFWRRILRTDFAIPEGHSLDQLTQELMVYLGSPDPELRDEFAYLILANWIRRGFYDAQQLRAIAQTCLRNTQVGLGDTETDSVFLRSFSVLILAAIIARDNADPFLDGEEIHRVFDTVLDYVYAERDLRGYVPDKGWAHAIAHAADCLHYLAQSQQLGGQHLEQLAIGIASRMAAPVTHIYHHDEDERMALAVMAVAGRNLLDVHFWEEWLGSLAQPILEAGFNLERNAQVQNIKHFLRSLYFQLALTPSNAQSIREFRLAVLTTIKRTHRYVGD